MGPFTRIAARMYEGIKRLTPANMPKRNRRKSGGSSSGSPNSSRKRCAQQNTTPNNPNPPDSSSSMATTSTSTGTDGVRSDSTNTSVSPSTVSTQPSTPSPKPKKRNHVKAILRKFSRKEKPSTSSGSDGASDTSIEDNSPSFTRSLRTSLIPEVPEVTVTPSSDNSADASPNASVRTMYRIDPRTGKPVQEYNLSNLSPRSAAKSLRRSSPVQRKRSDTTLPFPARSSSLRHSDEFPFDPKTAVRRDDDSDNWSSNPPSPVRHKSVGAQMVANDKANGSSLSLDKPLPALPQEERLSTLDFFASGAMAPVPMSPPRGENNDDDDTPRTSAQWPLPAERRSVYGPLSPILNAEEPVPSSLTANLGGNGSNNASDQLAPFGLSYTKATPSGRNFAARMEQLQLQQQNIHSSLEDISLEDFPAVPITTTPPPPPPARAPPGIPITTNAAGPIADVIPVERSSLNVDDLAVDIVSARASMVSVRSSTTTAASFVTAVEGAVGDVEEDEAGTPEGSNGFVLRPSSDQVPSPSDDDDKDAAKLGSSISSRDGADDPHLGLGSSDAEGDNDSMTEEDASDNENAVADGTVLPINGHFPPQPDAGPNVDLIEDQQGKLKWCPGNLPMPEPIWVAEPRISSIKSVVAAHIDLFELDKDDFEVECFAEGSFNKLYTIRSASKAPGAGPEYIFRTCLPAYPWYKLESEIATMELVRMCTNIPVPKVYAFDSDSENPVGHEWMIMDKIKGKSFQEARASMNMEQKRQLAETLAHWMHQLSMISFDKIGSVYRRREKPVRNKKYFRIGPIIDQTFMADWRLEYKVHRGPYTSLEQFFRALVDVNLFDAIDPRQRKRSEFCAALQELAALERTTEECTNSYERRQVEKTQEKWADKPGEKEARISQLRAQVEELRKYRDKELNTVVWDRPRYPLNDVNGSFMDPYCRIPKICQGLQFVLPHLCPPERLGPNSTVLHHWDISDNNILIDDAGNPVALVDWEQVQTLPFSVIDPYPAAISDEYDIREAPKPLKGDEHENFVETYNQNVAFHENFLLRQTFKARLEELRSPHLAAFEGQSAELKQLLRLSRFADQVKIRSEVEELVEKIEDGIGRGF